ncbi:type I secretion system permease/ATPase [Legionella hackeliae]|uniref:type I secretion system permease/ATPase n=1 Tax=Legionella hackeliae TaxID=449 RepID=UPI000E20415E|nr:type I secretion system permease/ATPase [Legionella hackeliae]
MLKEIFLASRSAYLYVGFFSLFINLLMLTIPLYMMQIFDRVLASHSYETLIYLTLIAILALLVLSLLDVVRTNILIHISTWFDRKVSPIALALSPDQLLQGNPYPEQVLRDVSTMRSFLGGSAMFTFFDAPWIPIYLIVIFMLNPILGLISTIGAILLFACALANEYATKKTMENANNMAISNNNDTTATLRNSEVIQAMGMLYPLINNWYTNNEKVLLFQTRSSKVSGYILSCSKFLRFCLQILILGVGAYYVLTNQITSGMMIAGSIMMARALAPVEQAIGAWKQFQGFKQARSRLEPHFMFISGRKAGLKLPKPKGILSLENLFYSPPNMQKLIISGITHKIQAGEMVALIGASAAGKSTLARLIVGVLKPNTGTVRLDGADVYQWERDDFGQYIGYLPQDIELFAGTVKDNIARMSEVNDAEVVKAAQLAGCHEMILRLPEGYNTVIRRDSFNLSGGQRQRIALARTLYKEPKLVILDEPNSNLDNEGEIALLKTLQVLKENGVTVIIIAHRPSIIRHVDTIIVLNEGKIQFSGPREQILAKLHEFAKNPKLQEGKGIGNG